MNKRTLFILFCFFALLTSSVYAADAETDKVSDEKKEETSITDIDITRITSKGRLVIDYNNKIAEFFEQVRVHDKNGIMDSDYLKVIFTSDGLSISKMVAAGNVVIKQKKRTTYSDSAIYVLQSEVLRLIGNPKILEEGNMYTADEITVLIKQNKVLFEPSAKIMINDKAKE